MSDNKPKTDTKTVKPPGGFKERSRRLFEEKKDKEIKSFDDMSVNELIETNSILNDNVDAVAKQLKTAHNYYDVKNFINILTRFATSEVGANAKVMMVLPEGRSPLQKEFNIKEITLVENKIIGSREKYRCVILVQ